MLNAYTGSVICVQAPDISDRAYGIYCGSRNPSAAVAYTAARIFVFLMRVALGNEQAGGMDVFKGVSQIFGTAYHNALGAVRQLDVATNGRQLRTRFLG